MSYLGCGPPKELLHGPIYIYIVLIAESRLSYTLCLLFYSLMFCLSHHGVQGSRLDYSAWSGAFEVRKHCHNQEMHHHFPTLFLQPLTGDTYAMTRDEISAQFFMSFLNLSFILHYVRWLSSFGNYWPNAWVCENGGRKDFHVHVRYMYVYIYISISSNVMLSYRYVYSSY